jgi:hypothetical protein
MTQSGIDRGAPAIRSTGQALFTLLSADANGVKESFVGPAEAATYEGADLDGALMTVDGTIDGTDARNVTIALDDVADGFVAGAQLVVRGLHPYYAAIQREVFTIPDTDGDVELVGAKMFRAGQPLAIDMPACCRAASLATVLPPWDFAPGDTLTLKIDDGSTETATFDAAVAVSDSVAQNYALTDGSILAIKCNASAVFNAVIEATPAEPVVSGNAEPFAVSNGQTLLVNIDGSAQTVTVACATATLVTSVNTEPYAFTGGETLEFDLDGAAEVATFDCETAAPVVSGNAEPFAVTNGMALVFDLDGTEETATVACATAPVVVSVSVEPFVFLGGETLLFDLDGAAQVVAFGGGSFSAAEVAAVINLQAEGSPASVNTGAVVLSSPIVGTDSEVDVNGGTANAILAFPTAASVGTGDFADASVATAAELVAAINADVTGSPASDDGGYVSLASAIVGTDSEIHITGGMLQVALDFPTEASVGTGDFADASIATATEVAAAINADCTGSPASVSASAVRLSSAIIGTDSEVDVNGGTANAILALPTVASFGTGDFANAAEATAAELAAACNADLTGSPASADDGALVLSSLLVGGTASRVQVTGGTLQTTLDCPTGNSLGDGNVANAGAVTAAEIVALLATLVGGVASVATNKVRITASGDPGTASTILVSGSANTALLFSATKNGTGDVANINAVTYDEFKTVVEADTNAGVETVGGYASVYKPSMASGDDVAITGGNVRTVLGFDTDRHYAGGFTIGCGVAREITPPAAWLYANETGTWYVHLRSDPDGRIVKCVVPVEGAYPISADALHASTDIDDMWAVSEP